MEKIAIDLTWVRHNCVGGTESSVRNLLHGLGSVCNEKIKFFLLTSIDNNESFLEYSKYSCFELVKCNVFSASQPKRVLWQNFKMGKVLRTNGIQKCLEPVYCKPLFGTKGIDYYTIIHDLQAYHYPEYFNALRNLWMRFWWWIAVHTSKKIIAISEFVKYDILKRYRVNEDKIVTIYDAIDIDIKNISDVDLYKKYNIKGDEFYYTVSSLLPHKNLETIIKAMALLKKDNAEAFYPLVISGVGGKSKDQLIELCKKLNLESDIILTPFVEDSERNRLYKECRLFLFPSVFEGFGMPPIEAMAFGKPVLTTRMTSIEEVTESICEYVENPFDENEWKERICKGGYVVDDAKIKHLLEKYSKREIALQFLDLLY